MSRTFRRKGYEKTINYRPGGKVAGYYTIVDHCWSLASKKERRIYIEEDDRYRAPTKREYYHKYWNIHSDSHHNVWGPSKSYRENRMVENRTINKQEIAKWLKNENYEPLTERNPRSCLWDWE